MQLERAAARPNRREAVLLQQIEDRDRALVLDLGVAAHDGVLVERDLGDALVVPGIAPIRLASAD